MAVPLTPKIPPLKPEKPSVPLKKESLIGKRSGTFIKELQKDSYYQTKLSSGEKKELVDIIKKVTGEFLETRDVGELKKLRSYVKDLELSPPYSGIKKLVEYIKSKDLDKREGILRAIEKKLGEIKS